MGFSGRDRRWSGGEWGGGCVQGGRELGWVEGRTVALEYRWSEGRTERYRELALELIGLNVDVIVTTGGAVSAVREATSTIPTQDFSLKSSVARCSVVPTPAEPKLT